MVQVKIFVLRSSLDDIRASLSGAIHSAVMEAFTYPVEKKFHRFIGMDRADFIHPADRSGRYIIIEFSIFEGRSIEAKKLLIRRLYELIPEQTGIQPQDIEITIFETPRHTWGIRGMPGDEVGLPYKVEA